MPELRREIDAVYRQCDALTLDLSALESFDSSGMALLVEYLERGRRDGKRVELSGLQGPVCDFFSLLSVERLLDEKETKARTGFVERVGDLVLPMVDSARVSARTVGSALMGAALAPFRKEKLRFGRTAEEIFLAGNGGVPIVILIAFLLGMILAMQAWVQLRIFAAELFIADMVAVSVTREIGPLMTAILVAARSGSSIAAQLGTMVINEEVASLEQMGVHPGKYLVVPKILALAISTPCLAMLFSGVAIVGGALFGVTVVGLEWGTYLDRTHTALQIHDLLGCILKSTVFGGLVASVACGLGLNVTGGPEGVGRATTGSVVASIFLIIVVDAVFVLLFKVGL